MTIVSDLQKRIEVELGPRNPLAYLKSVDLEVGMVQAISALYLFSRVQQGNDREDSILFVELACAIGHGMMRAWDMKKNSSIAAKTGAFVLWSFEAAGITELSLQAPSHMKRNKKHATYCVKILNDQAIVKMWEKLDIAKIEKLPSETPYAPWTSAFHPTGARMIKTGCKDTLKSLNPQDHPMVFEAINRAQSVGWNINKEIYDVQVWALRNKSDAFADIWEQQDPRAKMTKLREARAIASIAKRFHGKTFYHLYYYDFRCRRYPTTTYLHEQGSDQARALLKRSDSAVLGEEGFMWLFIILANYWAGDAERVDGRKTDKIPVSDRLKWAMGKEEVFLGYAESPKQNQGWMQADKPWQFLAACFELRRIRLWQMSKAVSEGKNAWEYFEDFSCETHFEGYIDGSNNGSQHLAALTRDEVTAPLVNLVPQEFPGDLYLYVADKVWEGLESKKAAYPEQMKLDAAKLIEELAEAKRQIHVSEPHSEARKELVENIKVFKEENLELLKNAAVVFWCMFTDSKHRRKLVKRNVMTLPYGGTAYGLGQQIIKDARKHGIQLLAAMEHRWGAFLGREVFVNCGSSLRRPMSLLRLFERAGMRAEEEGRFLEWTVPVTNFPVKQFYTEGEVKKLYVQYGPPQGERKSTGYYENTLQLAVCYVENKVQSKGKQSSGASPNCIHSLDAAHLVMTVCECDFNITTIHDSYGALLPHVSQLSRNVRKTFVDLHKGPVLENLLKEIGEDIKDVDLGTYDINDFLEAEYGFI